MQRCVFRKDCGKIKTDDDFIEVFLCKAVDGNGLKLVKSTKENDIEKLCRICPIADTFEKVHCLRLEARKSIGPDNAATEINFWCPLKQQYLYYQDLTLCAKCKNYVEQIGPHWESLVGVDSKTDYLSDLFMGYIPSFLRKANENSPIGIINIDVNRFKIINDSYGHSVGDMVLKNVASIVRRTFEKNMINAKFARPGGDEFIILVENIDIDKVQKTFRSAFNEIKEKNYGRISQANKPTLSVGIRICKDNKYESNNILEQSDEAMYKAKKRSRKTNKSEISVYEDTVVKSTNFKTMILNCLNWILEKLRKLSPKNTSFKILGIF